MSDWEAVLAIIGKWPSLSDFAGDIGVTYGAAKQMRRRRAIPAAHWKAVVTAAGARGLRGVEYRDLADAHAARTQPVAEAAE